MSASDPEKSVDLPPRGDRNADPITGAPGSHPIETGIGAAVAGAATGMAVGTVAGPIGTAVGMVAGAIAGGLAGKGVGEYIDPTTDDTYLRDNYASRPYVKPGDTFEKHVPAYQYGAKAEAKHADKPYDAVEEDLKGDWSDEDMIWDSASPAIRDGYERSAAIRKQRSPQA